ncbi:MAG TPA: PilZ domain-containing protein [Beijerinckiaceae bacterium]|jgi:methyl-accepting chemotaxis protein
MNRRISPRHRVLGHGQIIARGIVTNCVIRDLSDTGAKLGVSHKVRLPAEFHLLFVKRNLRLRVRLVRREGDIVGVSFVDMENAVHNLRRALADAGEDRTQARSSGYRRS